MNMKKLLFVFFIPLLLCSCEKGDGIVINLPGTNVNVDVDVDVSMKYGIIDSSTIVMDTIKPYSLRYYGPKELQYEEVWNSILDAPCNDSYSSGFGTFSLRAHNTGETSIKIYNEEWDTIFCVLVK